MPPKRSAGRGRPATRGSARRSNTKTPFSAPEHIVTETPSSLVSNATADECFSTPSDAAATVAPSTTTPLQSPANKVGADAGYSTDSPVKAAHPFPSGKEPSNDAVLGDAQTAAANGSSERPSVKEVALSNDVGLDPEAHYETGGNPNSVSADSKEGFLSSSEPQEKKEVDMGVGEDGPSKCSPAVGGDEATAVTEASGKDAVMSSSDGAGKTKRVVKKTVKVMKKIIKRVPKRCVRAGLYDSKADALVKPQANGHLGDAGSVPSCSNSGEKEAENLRTSASCSSIVENSNTGASPVVKVEETQQNMVSDDQIVQNKQDLEALEESLKERITENEQNLGAVDEKSQVQKNEQNLEVIDKKEGILLMEVDENKDGAFSGDAKGKEVSGEAFNEDAMVKEASGEAFNGDGNRKRVRDEVEDENNNATKPEDEMGNGTYYSGEMEAMERRKRRKTEIFVGGLDKDAKEEDIRKVFGEVGEIVDVRLPMAGGNRRNKGYAFLRYTSAVDAKKALEKFSNVEICGKQCIAAPVEGNDTIYVGNIDKKWKDEDVSKLLLDIGIEKIDTISVMKDPSNNGRNRGYAFVEFETCKDAQIAFKKLQKKDVFGGNSKVKVAWAEPLNELDEGELLKVKTVYTEFIPLTWDEEKVREIFKEFGDIDNVVLARNLRNAKRKDFAFISYKSREAAIACIESFGQEPPRDDGTKVNLKVSLALPLARGRQTKQVANPAIKEIRKEKPTLSPGNLNTKPIDQKNKGRLAVHHYGIHRAEHSSVTAEHVQRVRQQASWWQPPRTGPVNIDYPTVHSGGKQPISALEPGSVHSNLKGYPHIFEASMHTSSSREYTNGYSNYLLETSLPVSTRHYAGGLPHRQLDTATPTSSRYHLAPPGVHPTSSMYPQRRDIYTSGLPYVVKDHSTSKVGNETLGRSSLYQRY